MSCALQVIRNRIIKEGLRVDGRQLDEVRPLFCESSTYPILHGSALFSRGDTQVLSLSLSLSLSKHTHARARVSNMRTCILTYTAQPTANGYCLYGMKF
jgi:polyribonucleotide nucleotidyltransferase